MFGIIYTTWSTSRHGFLNNWEQSDQGSDEDPSALASKSLEFLGCRNAPDVGITKETGSEEDKQIYTVTFLMGTNDFSRGESRKAMRLPEKVNYILELILAPSLLSKILQAFC